MAITNQWDDELVVNVDDASHSLVQEDNITVIRKYPMAAPTLEMKNTLRVGNIVAPVNESMDYTVIPAIETCPLGINPEIGTLYEFDSNGGGDALVIEDLNHDFQVGDVAKVSTLVNNILVEGRIRITGINIDDISNQDPGPMGGPVPQSQNVVYIDGTLLSISAPLDDSNLNWTIELEQDDPMFEFKFPRFAYRYKYDDGEYSAISPFSEVAFLPDGGSFDYLPN